MIKLYKVIAGTFQRKQQASDCVSFLKNRGIEAFELQILLGEEAYYRVQAGAFKERSNAEQRLKEIQQSGIERAYILQAFSNQTFRNVETQGCCGSYFITGEANVQEDTFYYAVEDGHRYFLKGAMEKQAPSWFAFTLQLWIPKDQLPLNGTLILELFETDIDGRQTHLLPIVLESFQEDHS